MTTLAIIPARYASTRFPGKPLALIAGKPMIVRVWERVAKARMVDAAVVATEDERIAEACHRHGMAVEMTGSHHVTGTDRLAEVAQRRMADLYVNVQGDEPLIAPEAIDAVTGCLADSLAEGVQVSTAYIAGTTPEQDASRSVVKLVATMDGKVLNFSRLPVPHDFQEAPVRNIHVGLYAFTGEALARFAAWERGPTERAEGIELLRFLERGWRIACVPIAPGSIGIDHPEDILRAERLLAAAQPE